MELVITIIGILITAGLLFLLHRMVDQYNANQALIKFFRKEIEDDLVVLEEQIEGFRDKEYSHAKRLIDREFLENLTKTKINSLAQGLDIQVSVHKRKADMIEDFLTALNNK